MRDVVVDGSALTVDDVVAVARGQARVKLGDEWLLQSARKRLSETQRSDGGWDSDEGPTFDVNTTLIAIRAVFDGPRSARAGISPS